MDATCSDPVIDCMSEDADCPICSFKNCRRPIVSTNVQDGFSHGLLHTNEHMPPHIDTPSLRHAIDEYTSTLAKVDANICDAQRALEMMKKRRQSIATSLYDLHSSLHPIRTLPNEIIATIFEWTSPLVISDRRKYSEHNSLDMRQAPWTLSQVCRRWRSLALSYPRLWSIVNISLPLPIRARNSPPETPLSLQLERSGSSDLKVRIYQHHRNTLSASLRKLLQQHSARWTHLEVETEPFILQQLSGFSFEKLEYLRVDFSPFDSMDRQTVDSFRAADSLTRFEHIQGPNITMLLPWSSIKIHKAWQIGLPYLAQLQAVQNLNIYDRHALNMRRLVFSPMLSPFTLPALLGMTIFEYSSPDGFSFAKYLFEHLHAPTLQSLSLVFRDCKAVQLPSFVHGADSLLKLKITVASSRSTSVFSADDLISLLRQTPNLQELSLSELACPVEILQALSSVSGGESTSNDSIGILRCLQVLKLCCGTVAKHFDVAKEVVQSRLHGRLTTDESSMELRIFRNDGTEEEWETCKRMCEEDAEEGEGLPLNMYDRKEF